jgi:DNA invertase Pin-like site-specific DNA recombinase
VIVGTASIYLRVSTAGQATEGVSLEAQEARARKWAEANGYEVAGLHCDAGISGKRAENRPGLQAALTEVCRTRGALVVYSLSRLARSTKDAISIAERLEKAGADLVSLSEKIDTTSAAGKMIFRMLAVLAEFERDLISERTKGAMAHMAAQGRRVGEVPYGFRLAEDGLHLIDYPAEQEALRAIRNFRAHGLTWNQIAEEMNRRGLRTKKGRPWSWRTALAAA